MLRRHLLAGGAGLFASGPALAASASSLVKGLYLPELEMYRRKTADDPDYGQFLAQMYASCGDERAAFRAWRQAGVDPERTVGGLGEYRADNAIQAIVAAAKGRRIVMLNEAHHVSRTRAFAREVALRLRNEGFSLFAAETFSNKPDGAAPRLNTGAPVTTELGLYASDPVFADLLRSARATGFRFVPYEQTSEQSKARSAVAGKIDFVGAREEAEAVNFIAGVLDANPDARVLVHCGFGHLSKFVGPGKPRMFAARLKEKTGIDPLSVSQSEGSPAPDSADATPLVEAVLERFKPAASIVVRNREGGNPGGFKGVDLAVFHPRLPDVEGRPGWLAAAPGRSPVVVPLSEPTREETLLQATPADEAARARNAVPADQYRVGAGERRAVFHLRAGRYALSMEVMSEKRSLGAIRV